MDPTPGAAGAGIGAREGAAVLLSYMSAIVDFGGLFSSWETADKDEGPIGESPISPPSQQEEPLPQQEEPLTQAEHTGAVKASPRLARPSETMRGPSFVLFVTPPQVAEHDRDPPRWDQWEVWGKPKP
ncbi:hypothetical protein M8818_003509 [Zalaria obscura]|uniref:Uncharacterized protein n=1 Tax=Zalaria obscura TaxID=2024903 RepID=A0ACC3SFB9_9PEZI